MAVYDIDESLLMDLVACGFARTPEEALHNAIALSKRTMKHRARATGEIIIQDRDRQVNVSMRAFTPIDDSQMIRDLIDQGRIPRWNGEIPPSVALDRCGLERFLQFKHDHENAGNSTG